MYVHVFHMPWVNTCVHGTQYSNQIVHVHVHVCINTQYSNQIIHVCTCISHALGDTCVHGTQYSNQIVHICTCTCIYVYMSVFLSSFPSQMSKCTYMYHVHVLRIIIWLTSAYDRSIYMSYLCYHSNHFICYHDNHLRSILFHIAPVKASIYAISFIVWSAELYLIYGLSFVYFWLQCSPQLRFM